MDGQGQPIAALTTPDRERLASDLDRFVRRAGCGYKWQDSLGFRTLWVFDKRDDRKRRRLEFDPRWSIDGFAKKVSQMIDEIWDDWFDPERWEALGELLA